MAIFTPFSVVLALLKASIIFLILRIVYRLTFHPLATFPGPRLAAITSLYAGAFDLPYGSSFCKKIPELHDKYGPIVRIMPNQLHIRDMDSFNQVYKPGTRFRKDPKFYNSHIVDGSFFNICDTKEAKIQKDLYLPYFSQAAIQRLESSIHGKVNIFFNALQTAAGLSKVVDLTLGFKCLAADVVMQYSFQKTFGALDAPDFRFGPILDLEQLFVSAPLAWYFPELINLMSHILVNLPRSVVERIMKPLASTFEIQKSCRERILALASEDIHSSITPSVFQTALHPDKQKEQSSLSLKALSADALLFFAAGTDTTAHTLTCGTWYLLNNPNMTRLLREELVSAIPDTDSATFLNWTTLEKLPYLRAVVKESLRLSFGVPGRISRVVPVEGAVFCGRHVPPGTVISHSAYSYHMSEQYFLDAKSFKPERWLGPDSAELEKNLVSFSRGSRSCLGVNLAYAEIFTVLAYLFRKFDLEIRGTTAYEMDWDDCFTPATFGHLKVAVKELDVAI